MTTFVLLLFAIIIFLVVGLGIKDREIDTGIGTPETRIISETDSPRLFWVMVCIYTLIGLLCGGLAIIL